MENRNTFLQHAPYLYLARPAGEEFYYLFVAIRKRVNEKIQVVRGVRGQAISYDGGQASIAFSIKPKTGVPAGEASDFFLMRYKLEPQVEENTAFNPEASWVQVSVTVKAEEGGAPVEAYENAMAYSDADGQPIPAGRPESKPAYNCPYVYLEHKVRTEGKARKETYYPYVLLALKGYRLGRNDKTTGNSSGNDALEAIVVLTKTEQAAVDGRFHPFVDPGKLEVNTREYPDNEQDIGNFTVTLVFTDSEEQAEDPVARSRGLQDKKQAGSAKTSSAGKPESASGIAMRKAKTRNMSSRRNRSRHVDFNKIA